MVAENISKYITSTNYPNVHNDNENCWWLIYSQTYVKIEIINLDIEECCDNVKIYDGDDVGEKLMEDLKSGHIGKKYTSTGRYFSIIFMSDSSVSHNGFSIRYWQTDKPGGGKTDTTDAGGIIGGVIGVTIFAVVIYCIDSAW